MVCGCFYFLWFWHGSLFPLKEFATAYKNHLFAAGQQKFLSEDNKVGSTQKTEQQKCGLLTCMQIISACVSVLIVQSQQISPQYPDFCCPLVSRTMLVQLGKKRKKTFCPHAKQTVFQKTTLQILSVTFWILNIKIFSMHVWKTCRNLLNPNPKWPQVTQWLSQGQQMRCS